MSRKYHKTPTTALARNSSEHKGPRSALSVTDRALLNRIPSSQTVADLLDTDRKISERRRLLRTATDDELQEAFFVGDGPFRCEICKAYRDRAEIPDSCQEKPTAQRETL